MVLSVYTLYDIYTGDASSFVPHCIITLLYIQIYTTQVYPHSLYLNHNPPLYSRGVPRIWMGGAKNFFFRFGNLHVAKRHAAHGEAMRIARGVRGHAPRENFLKRCNLVRFRVYFDQILSLFFSKNAIFI